MGVGTFVKWSLQNATNYALRLAKELHKAPMAIAEELKEKLDGATTSTPGFINFSLTDNSLNTAITNLSENFEENVTSNEYAGETIICEFSDPNPFKVLHVGHLYTSIVGDSISRLFENAGAKVIRANFGGDVGLHVAKTMYVLRQKSIEELTIEDIARCYVEGTALYDNDETAHTEITQLNKEIYKINTEGILHRRVAELGGPPRSLSDVGEEKVRQDPSRGESYVTTSRDYCGRESTLGQGTGSAYN